MISTVLCMYVIWRHEEIEWSVVVQYLVNSSWSVILCGLETPGVHDNLNPSGIGSSRALQ